MGRARKTVAAMAARNEERRWEGPGLVDQGRERARSYQIPTSREGREFTTVALCNELRRKDNLLGSEIATILFEEYGPRLVPRLKATEIARAVGRSHAMVFPEQHGTPEPAAKPSPVGPEPSTNGRPKGDEDELPVRIYTAADWREEALSWLYDPWIAKGVLTLVTGRAGTGKSTLGAWMMHQAGRAVLLPGHEEPGGTLTQGRLNRAGVRLDSVAVLREKQYVLPHDKSRVARIVEHWRANLLWIDPLQSYQGGINPNEGMYVRPFLESLTWVAERTGAAVVGVVHPGKASDNLLPGAHEWRDVPRTVLELLYDRGPPERRIIQADKDSLGAEPPPSAYRLDGLRRQPKLWVWGDPCPAYQADELRNVIDHVEKWKIDEAEDFLRLVLAEGEQEAWWLVKQAAADGLNDRVLRRAARRIGAETRREGCGREHRSYWRLPSVTPDTPDTQAGHP